LVESSSAPGRSKKESVKSGSFSESFLLISKAQPFAPEDQERDKMFCTVRFAESRGFSMEFGVFATSQMAIVAGLSQCLRSNLPLDRVTSPYNAMIVRVGAL